MQKRLLIIGNGFFGSAIATEAVSRNFETRVLTGSKPKLHGSFEVVVGDAGDFDLLNPLCRNIDHIVYAAGGSEPATVEADPATALHKRFPLC